MVTQYVTGGLWCRLVTVTYGLYGKHGFVVQMNVSCILMFSAYFVWRIDCSSERESVFALVTVYVGKSAGQPSCVAVGLHVAVDKFVKINSNVVTCHVTINFYRFMYKLLQVVLPVSSIYPNSS